MFRRLKNWAESHKALFALIITLLFILVHIPLLINHEISNDEAISWRLSERITFDNFYEINSAEPHPPLWQLILAPFSKLGFPVITLGIISLVFVALAVFLVFRFAPMNFFIKVIFLFSSAFFYFLPIVSRDYSMIPLALALICILYKNRHEKPFLYGLSLAFLSQTHFLMYGLVIALSLGFIVETILKKDKKRLKKIFVFSLPLLISALTVFPIITSSLQNHAIITEKAFENTTERESFIENAIQKYSGFYNEYLPTILLVGLIIAALAFFLRNQKTALYLFAGFGFWFFSMIKIYQEYHCIFELKIALLFLITFAIIWLNYVEEDKENFISKLLNKSEIIKVLRKIFTKNWYVIFALILIIPNVAYTILSANRDFAHAYTNSKETAEFINDMEPGSVLLIGDITSSLNSATRVYIKNDIKVYNIRLGKYEDGTEFLKYDNESYERDIEAGKGLISNEELADTLNKFASEYEHVYYFVYPPVCGSHTRDYGEVLKDYKFVKMLNNEKYYDTTHIAVAAYKIK